MTDTMQVATSGSIPLSHKCINCCSPMLYRMHKDGAVAWMFCGDPMCAEVFVRKAVPRAD